MPKLQQALDRFDALYKRAAACDLNEPAAVTVATVDADGCPSARVVLLKGYDASGFVFYTNTLSRKGYELAANPHVAMCFFWDPLMEQVRVEGRVSSVTDAEADAYWNSRHPGSRIGAWASDQSEPLESRETLEARVAAFAERFGDGPVPRPSHWSGYRVAPFASIAPTVRAPGRGARGGDHHGFAYHRPGHTRVGVGPVRAAGESGNAGGTGCRIRRALR